MRVDYTTVERLKRKPLSETEEGWQLKVVIGLRTRVYRGQKEASGNNLILRCFLNLKGTRL
jgi:hypothetical protein